MTKILRFRWKWLPIFWVSEGLDPLPWRGWIKSCFKTQHLSEHMAITGISHSFVSHDGLKRATATLPFFHARSARGSDDVEEAFMKKSNECADEHSGALLKQHWVQSVTAPSRGCRRLCRLRILRLPQERLSSSGVDEARNGSHGLRKNCRAEGTLLGLSHHRSGYGHNKRMKAALEVALRFLWISKHMTLASQMTSLSPLQEGWRF